MKFLKIIFPLILSHFICAPTIGQIPNVAKKNALLIIESNLYKFDTINQLLIVYNEVKESNSAILIAMERHNEEWEVKFDPMLAGIGRKGFADLNTKYEGDGRTPTGLFLLGQLFCYEPNIKTSLPYIQSNEDDKWIDDPKSKDYNKHVRGHTSAKSFEKLLLETDVYKFCMVIEYNTHPVIKGKGSAIFFHLGEEKPGHTAGCVAINETNMRKIIKWLDPNSKPAILMGNFDDLRNGL